MKRCSKARVDFMVYVATAALCMGCANEQDVVSDAGATDTSVTQDADGENSSSDDAQASESASAHGTAEHAAIVVTEATFEELVLKSELPVMTDFGATWCGPCRLIAPAVEEMARQYSGRAVIAKIDVDENPGLVNKYQITGFPTFIFFKNGEVADVIVGVPDADLDKAGEMLRDRLNKLVGDAAPE